MKLLLLATALCAVGALPVKLMSSTSRVVNTKVSASAAMQQLAAMDAQIYAAGQARHQAAALAKAQLAKVDSEIFAAGQTRVASNAARAKQAAYNAVMNTQNQAELEQQDSEIFAQGKKQVSANAAAARKAALHAVVQTDTTYNELAQMDHEIVAAAKAKHEAYAKSQLQAQQMLAVMDQQLFQDAVALKNRRIQDMVQWVYEQGYEEADYDEQKVRSYWDDPSNDLKHATVKLQ